MRYCVTCGHRALAVLHQCLAAGCRCENISIPLCCPPSEDTRICHAFTLSHSLNLPYVMREESEIQI